MGLHKCGDEESSVQEDSCGKTILAHGSASVCQLEIEIERELTRMAQREEDDELHTARVHMQFVCRMYKFKHDEGGYFLHEHCQGELPWLKDCVEEVQEMTSAKLMSVRRGNCNLPSNEKPTVMVTSCPAIALTLRVSAKVRFLNKRYSEHLERNEHKSIEDLHEDISCGIRLQHKWSRQHKYLLASVNVKNSHVNFNDLENSVPLEESNDELLDQAWDHPTGESLDAKKVKEAGQVEMEYYDKMHVFENCLLLSMLGEDRQLRARWISKQMGGQTVQRIRQRRVVCCNSAN